MLNKITQLGPYPQLSHKIKMAAICGGLCTEILWRGYRFAMNDIKKFKNISGEAYCIYNHTMQMHVLCLAFQLFGWFLLFLAN